MFSRVFSHFHYVVCNVYVFYSRACYVLALLEVLFLAGSMFSGWFGHFWPCRKAFSGRCSISSGWANPRWTSDSTTSACLCCRCHWPTAFKRERGCVWWVEVGVCLFCPEAEDAQLVEEGWRRQFMFMSISKNILVSERFPSLGIWWFVPAFLWSLCCFSNWRSLALWGFAAHPGWVNGLQQRVSRPVRKSEKKTYKSSSQDHPKSLVDLLLDLLLDSF